MTTIIVLVLMVLAVTVTWLSFRTAFLGEKPEFRRGDIISRPRIGEDGNVVKTYHYHITDVMDKEGNSRWYECWPCDAEGNHITEHPDDRCIPTGSYMKTGHRRVR